MSKIEQSQRFIEELTPSEVAALMKDADLLHRAFADSDGPHIIHLRTGNMTMRNYHRIVAPVWDHACALSQTCVIVQVY